MDSAARVVVGMLGMVAQAGASIRQAMLYMVALAGPEQAARRAYPCLAEMAVLVALRRVEQSDRLQVAVAAAQRLARQPGLVGAVN